MPHRLFDPEHGGTRKYYPPCTAQHVAERWCVDRVEQVWASPTWSNGIRLTALAKRLAIYHSFPFVRKEICLTDKPNKAGSRKSVMAFLDLWSFVFAVLEALFGVLKSKSANGLDFTFWMCLLIEFACACVPSAALFIGPHGASRVELRNRDMKIATSSLAIVIHGTLLVAEAVYIGGKLKTGSWFMLSLRRSILIFVVLLALLITPVIPIFLTGFWRMVNDCFAVNRSLLDPLTILVAASPFISLVTGFTLLKLVRELVATKRVAENTAIFVAYLFYSAPVLALGILLMRTPSDCDKHTILLMHNLIPAMLICWAALVLRADRNPDSENPVVPDENRRFAHTDTSLRLPHQLDTSRVSDGANQN